MQGCAKSGDVVEAEDVVEDKEVVEIGEDARFCTNCRSEKISVLPGLECGGCQHQLCLLSDINHAVKGNRPILCICLV